MAPRPLPVSKLRARRRKRRLIALLGIVIILILILCAAVGASWLPWLRLNQVKVSGATAVSSESIEREVKSVMSGTYFYLFARDNVFLYPREEMRTRLLAKFPSLRGVVIGADSLNTLLVAVSEREGAALWCGTHPVSNAVCYLLDESGAIFAPSANFGDEVYTRYYGPTDDKFKQFLVPEDYRSLIATVNTIKAKVLDDTLKSVVVENSEVHAYFTKGFELIFLLSDDGAKVVERFDLARTADPLSKHPLSDFEYLDLRFGDKLYYKLKGQ